MKLIATVLVLSMWSCHHDSQPCPADGPACSIPGGDVRQKPHVVSEFSWPWSKANTSDPPPMNVVTGCAACGKPKPEKKP